MIPLELNEVNNGVAFDMCLSCQADRVMSSIVGDHVGKEEAVCISDCQASTSHSYARLVALKDAVECRGMPSTLHAGHINDIEGALVLHS